MILRMSTIATLLAAASQPSSSLAFQCQHYFHPIRASHPPHSSSPRRLASPNGRAPTTTTATSTALQMSSIPDDNDDNNFLEKIKNYSLPPAPEDPIALGGDMVALFVYSYLDHTVNEQIADTAAKLDNVADLVATASYDPATGAADAATALPVWFDAAHLHTFGHNWLAGGVVEIPYAPAIAQSGLAFVSIATSWLLCGYFSGAFLNSNTLECTAAEALGVTLRTWMGMAILMVLLALGSDALWGWLDGMNALSAPARGGLTRADADFIFDSLTVLAFWRFMFNWLLGYRR